MQKIIFFAYLLVFETYKYYDLSSATYKKKLNNYFNCCVTITVGCVKYVHIWVPALILYK